MSPAGRPSVGLGVSDFHVETRAFHAQVGQLANDVGGQPVAGLTALLRQVDRSRRCPSAAAVASGCSVGNLLGAVGDEVKLMSAFSLKTRISSIDSPYLRLRLEIRSRRSSTSSRRARIVFDVVAIRSQRAGQFLDLELDRPRRSGGCHADRGRCAPECAMSRTASRSGRGRTTGPRRLPPVRGSGRRQFDQVLRVGQPVALAFKRLFLSRLEVKPPGSLRPGTAEDPFGERSLARPAATAAARAGSPAALRTVSAICLRCSCSPPKRSRKLTCSFTRNRDRWSPCP